MSDLVVFRLIFGLAALAFGAWLFPKWRAERRRSRARTAARGPSGMMGGRMAPRAVWLFFNTWSSLLLGAALVLSAF